MRFTAILMLAAISAAAFAESGDPQLKTDHPWYPGELSCSTFERLFATEAEAYTRATGRKVDNDEDKALAAWYWRNTHYWHGTSATCGYFKDLKDGSWVREYWSGLFAYGFGLCGTTHSQWCGEMEKLLGHGRSRVAGVAGHNSFEVFLTGGAYGEGKWVLLDHDISTVIFAADGSRLISIPEIQADMANLTNPNFKPERQRGWRIGGLYDSDPQAYKTYGVAEYGSGYYGPPPLVHLRAGECLRRYVKPGVETGKTFVYWGINAKQGIPGPARTETWVNQPEKMYNSKTSSGGAAGQARYGNAVYTYKPDFTSGAYKEGAIEEGADHVTFEFYTPYVIGSTPAPGGDWAVYESGGKNGLVLNGKLSGPVKVSVDQGGTWSDAGTAADGMDLTDFVKGKQQYWIRFGAAPKDLADSGLTLRTNCQCNAAIVPRLKNGGSKVTFLATGQAIVSAGPTKAQAEAHVVDGKIGTNTVTLELATPHKEKAVHIYAAAHVSCSCPPNPDVKYQIEYSTDGGKEWKPAVKDWQIVRHTPEPADFWSQTNVFGDATLDGATGATGPVRVRFKNDGGKPYQKVEAHLVYEIAKHGATDVTFAWKENNGETKTATHAYPAAAGKEDTSWTVPTGQNVETVWVEYSAK